MKKRMRIKIIHYLEESMQRSLASASHQLVAVGTIAFFGFILFYWVWTEWFPQPYENLFLRLLSSLLGLGLILTPYWPVTMKRYLPWYWFVTLVYTLSFFFAFSFLMSKASVISAMFLLCSVFLLVLVVDLLSLLIILLLGWGIALFFYFLLATPLYFGAEHIEMLLILLFVIIAGTTFNYKTAMLQQQRLAGMAAAAGMIAHELRTPLLGIKSGAQALAKHAPQLIKGYQEAKEHGLINQAFKERRLNQLEQVSLRIISEINYANTIIDMLLVNVGRENTLQNCTLELCSMADCIKEAISRYPFKSLKESNLVSWQGDFYFKGSKLLMQHVLFNLIKNALYAIAMVQKGDIRIWTKQGAKWQYLFFKDTAKGMTDQQQAKLFDHFYTTKFTGTGIGLSFCKLVMYRFGGNIHCEAKEGEYTLFTLSFPFYEN
ncbi:HAMP domain-containing histidine kinase [Legionella israelensis]|nr:HAMP domain-containing histidine kinase [Legionella israelensis]